jgi:hypothetical protein
VDTRTQITAQGSVTAPSLIVPQGVTKIQKVFVAAVTDGLAVGSAAIFIRLGGGGIVRGEQNIVTHAAGAIAVQAGSDCAPQIGQIFVLDNADLDVSPGDTISVAAEMAGSDLGTARIAVTLYFA